jgi:hypothetical protein
MSIPMNTDSQRAKLAALRTRTDRQLAALIHHELDNGLNHAHASLAGERDRAERAYTTAHKLLPAIYHLHQSERHRIEARLRELRALLDGRSAPGVPKLRTAGA